MYQTQETTCVTFFYYIEYDNQKYFMPWMTTAWKRKKEIQLLSFISLMLITQ